MVVICAGCERPIIMERFLLNVLDRVWHAGCVQCFDCKDTLTEKCFSRDGKLFCRQDFLRRFGTKCDGCFRKISPRDLVRRARSRVYHLPCFLCCVCGKAFNTGEELHMLDDNRLMCKNDYEQLAGTHEYENIKDKPTQSLAHSYDIVMSSDTEHDSDALLPSSTVTTSRIPAVNLRDNPGVTLCDTPGVTLGDTPGVTLRDVPGNLQNSDESDDDDDDDEISCDSNDEDKNTDNQSKDTTGSNNSKDASNNSKDTGNHSKGDSMDSSAPKRGPRTTIKATQLEKLKAAFAATPKPTRRIREELAQEAGLSMRVIQVWFQNRRSKERRMKQLNAFHPQRQFFLNNRHMRPLGSMEKNEAELGACEFGSYYVPENSVRMPPWSVNREDPGPAWYPHPRYHDQYASESIYG